MNVSSGSGLEAVETWLVDLDAPPVARDRLEATLSPDERARRDRLRRPRDRRRWAVGRGLVRHILAGYTGASPASLSFAYNPHGRPRVDGAPPFNVTHSEGLLAVGVGSGPALGVDVEHVQVLDDVLSVAAQVLVEDEMAHLRGLAEPARSRRFLEAWTAKEAVLKALGTGFSLPPTRLVLRLGADETALRDIHVPGEDATAWRLRTFEVAVGAGGAAVITVAARTPSLVVRPRPWLAGPPPARVSAAARSP